MSVATRNTNVSDEDLAAQQAKVEKLRQQVEDAERTRLENERSQHNAIRMAELQAEEARLTAQLTEARAVATKTAAREGAAAPLEAARNAAAQAQEQAAAAEKTASNNEKGE